RRVRGDDADRAAVAGRSAEPGVRPGPGRLRTGRRPRGVRQPSVTRIGSKLPVCTTGWYVTTRPDAVSATSKLTWSLATLPLARSPLFKALSGVRPAVYSSPLASLSLKNNGLYGTESRPVFSMLTSSTM